MNAACGVGARVAGVRGGGEGSLEEACNARINSAHASHIHTRAHTHRQGVRDLVKRWLMSFCEVGGLMKRLDVGEGNYSKELEEDFDVYDAMNQVRVRVVLCVCVCVLRHTTMTAHNCVCMGGLERVTMPWAVRAWAQACAPRRAGPGGHALVPHCTQVMEVTLANELKCEEFKGQFAKFDYLWKKDLQTSLREFCEENGTTLPGGEECAGHGVWAHGRAGCIPIHKDMDACTHADGTRKDQVLAKFEAQITH